MRRRRLPPACALAIEILFVDILFSVRTLIYTFASEKNRFIDM